MTNTPLIITGATLIAHAVIPDPSDVTVIIPAVEILLGVTLIGVGLFMNGKKR